MKKIQIFEASILGKVLVILQLLFLVAIICPIPNASYAESSTVGAMAGKKVLVVHSFPYALPSYQIIDNSLLNGLFSKGIDINNLYFEFLDLARNQGSEYRHKVIDFFQKKFESQKINLIITLHQEALLFVVNDLKTLFPDVPIIAVLGSGKTFEHPGGARPIFFLPFSIDPVATAGNIMALQPDTGKIFIVSGSSALDKRFEARIKNDLKAWKGAPVEYLGDLPMNEILAAVRSLPPRSAILYTTIYADKTGKTFMPPDALRMISAVANAPVFGLFETLLGNGGVVGGTMLDHRVEGERTARLAVEILEGKMPEKPLTVSPAPLTPMFDHTQLKRWGMDESQLPAGSVVINKPVSLWRTHRLLIVVSLMFFLAQTVLIALLIISRQRKKLAEESLKEAEKEARHARKELLRMERLSRMGELSASLSHELNQPLMSILSNAGAASMLLEQGRLDPEELKEILHDIIQDDKRAGEIIHGLRSMVKTEEGTVEIVAMDEVLREAVALFNSEAIVRNIKIDADIPGSLPLVKANRVQIEQVLINLMMNGAQAMEAHPVANKRLIIGAVVVDATIRVMVRDFGSGINESEMEKLFEPFFTTKRAGMGLGLSLSRSIMETHAGHIWAENNPDKGASFYFDIPIVKEENAVGGVGGGGESND